MASYSGSIDIKLIQDLNDKNIVSIKTIYYASIQTDVNNIPEPIISSDTITKVLRIVDGVLKLDNGALTMVIPQNKWNYDKPGFIYGLHLWTSLEILTIDGTVIYSEPVLSAEWESYYNIDVGGTNLIRNSKTLIDSRIFWN